jgi:addiction module RelE/StbE family toxin
MAENYRIVWSQRSLRDLNGIRAYIGQFAPLASQRFAKRLIAAVETLAQHPDRGVSVKGDVRELLVIAPYRIRYRVTADAVQIVRIRHGAQRPD